jgi:hypothetical protein
LGSLELTGAVRSHLLAGVSPDNPDQRVLVQMKSNLNALGPGLGYTIDSAGIFHWTGATELAPEEILSPSRGAEQKSALEEAEDFLHRALADGPENVWKIQRDAKEMMIAPITLQRAKRRLGLVSKKSAGSWQWFMAEKSDKPQAASDKQDPTTTTLGLNTQNKPQITTDKPSTAQQATESLELTTEASASGGDRDWDPKPETLYDHLEHLHIGRTASSDDRVQHIG